MSGALNILRRLERWSPWLYAVAALGPMLWCWGYVSDLFWFGDDWDLLDQIWTEGFWRWMARPFAENYTPVFKTLWTGAVRTSGGNYSVMMAVNWITHAGSVGLFAIWLRRSGFDTLVVGLSALGLGLAVANLESLAWSVQFSPLLAQLFFFAAAAYLEGMLRTESWSRSSLAILGLLVAGGALSFARGVLTGPALVAGLLLARLLPTDIPRLPWRRIVIVSVVVVAPCIFAAVMIKLYAGGNQQKLGGPEAVLMPAFWFGAYYLMATPLIWLIPLGTWGWRTVTFLGFVKGALLVGGWRAATANERRILAMLLLLDLASAALLGLGRYHTGLPSVTASRYQYVALVCFLPFLGLCLRAGVKRVRLPDRGRTLVAGVAVTAFVVHVAWEWPRKLDEWAGWRGRNARRILFETPDPPAVGAIPGIPKMTTERAREIVEHYHLH